MVVVAIGDEQFLPAKSDQSTLENNFPATH
jgi:hypothetical protein